MRIFKNQSGLSLIELVVVVAILGVLATLSYGPVSRQINKSKQAEAKSNLGALAQAEKMFNVEYQGFTSDMKAVGAIPEGRIRYNIGFNTDTSSANVGTGPVPVATTSNLRAAATGCGTAGSANGTAGAGICANALFLSEYTNSTTPAATSVVSSTAAYIAEANSRLAGAANDVWTINQNGVLTNTVANY